MKYKEIKETPFVLVEDETNNVCFTACSNRRTTDLLPLTDENIKKLTDNAKKINWENLIPVIEVLITKIKENGRNKKNQ